MGSAGLLHDGHEALHTFWEPSAASPRGKSGGGTVVSLGVRCDQGVSLRGGWSQGQTADCSPPWAPPPHSRPLGAAAGIWEAPLSQGARGMREHVCDCGEGCWTPSLFRRETNTLALETGGW